MSRTANGIRQCGRRASAMHILIVPQISWLFNRRSNKPMSVRRRRSDVLLRLHGVQLQRLLTARWLTLSFAHLAMPGALL